MPSMIPKQLVLHWKAISPSCHLYRVEGGVGINPFANEIGVFAEPSR